MFEVRTDLALEENERVTGQRKEQRGVRCEEETIAEGDMTISTVYIETENGAKLMGKPKGTYVTLEAAQMGEEDEDYHREVSIQLARILKQMLPKDKTVEVVLVAGLGNRAVTPDALGPRVVDNLCITRHLIQEYGMYAFGKEDSCQVCGIVPGVMAQTGMETREILAGVIKQLKPDCLIVIDALAARSTKRLGRTIQISNTGISPGSGVGNHRHAITRETVGVPVIAIGIPTVVDASTIVHDTMNNLITALAQCDHLKSLHKSWNVLDEDEKQELIRELLAPALHNMFVTPKDIDASIKQLSFTISEGLNICFA